MQLRNHVKLESVTFTHILVAVVFILSYSNYKRNTESELHLSLHLTLSKNIVKNNIFIANMFIKIYCFTFYHSHELVNLCAFLATFMYVFQLISPYLQ